MIHLTELTEHEKDILFQGEIEIIIGLIILIMGLGYGYI